MRFKHESVDVRISRRILWFNSEAYPLAHITRTNTLTWEPKRGTAIKKYVYSVLMWVLIAGLVSSAAPVAAAVVVDVAVVTWLVVKTIRFVKFLQVKLYELVIETAAGSNRALISDRAGVVVEIANQITDALNNPMAEYQIRVDNLQVGNGDIINVGGTNNAGKVVQ